MLLAGYSESNNATASSTAAVPSPIPNVQPAVVKRPQAIETAVLNQSAGFSNSVSLVMPVTAASTAAQVSLPHVQPASVLKPQAIETTVLNQYAGFSSSVSMVKPVVSLSTVEANPIKSVAIPALVKCPEPPKSDAVAAAGSAQNTSAVPQARKASLARFLEKRKERVTAASPYVASKNGSQCSNIGPGGSTLSGNLSPSSLLPATN
ncbi:hypothetical protein BVRB_1g016070 [Beta vulgaris subsp. vulgaris]|nr:hypothetical protein BVRB_1g016070 [Beta vulgaris subsp. vulgaris]